MFSLEDLGYGPFYAVQMELFEDGEELAPARVSATSHGLYELAGCEATEGELSGRLRRALGSKTRPTTGDWVAVAVTDGAAVIHHVLERQTVLQRRAARSLTEAQVVAANVEVFFVVTSANLDLNPRRLERYLTAVWDSGARPVIVLNKIDLVSDLGPLLQTIEEVAFDIAVVGVSALAGTGLDSLRGQLTRGTTFGFIGSSGVGKSSLINRLLGHDAQVTDDIRSDDRGRHATTRRELVVLPEGGVLIDTPGMRELGMLEGSGGLETAFSEVAELAEGCRFGDCQHDSEPHCAVRAAVESGALAAERLLSYQNLRREQASAETRRDPVLNANTKRRWKAIHKSMRAHPKTDPKGGQ